jgi:4-amino-4-deoxychorismate lyase
MCRFIESIRVHNGVFQHPEYHNRRWNMTRHSFWSGSPVWDVSDLVKIPEHLKEGVYKCRIVYDEQIRQVDFQPYYPRRIQTLRLVCSDDVSYPYKFEDRSVLEDLLEQKGDADDILIVRDGFLTDTSFANIALYDGSRWYTPETYLLNGTCRQRLLDEGILAEASIGVTDLARFQAIRPINAMLIFEETPDVLSIV